MIGEILAAGGVLTVLMSLWVAGKYANAKPKPLSARLPTNDYQVDEETAATLKKLKEYEDSYERSAESALRQGYSDLAKSNARESSKFRKLRRQLEEGTIDSDTALDKMFT